MRLPTGTDLYAWAWRHVRRLPDAPVRGAAHAVADVTWLVHTEGIRQLERNISRLRPDLDARQVRRTSRAAMRSYMRYFVEAFQLPGWSPERILARVRVEGLAETRAAMSDGRSIAAALGHTGNWDLAGAWACLDLAPVLTVAEKLPDGLYEQFVGFRAGLGMTIIPLEGSGTFRALLRASRTGQHVICLLADRDLSRHGIEVDIAGHRARVAAGPAALALALGIDLFAVAMRYERLTGARRRAAGSPWGLVVRFVPVATHTPDGARRSIEDLTQAWVTTLFDVIAASPEDWHMLQKVFLSDLDPARLARQHEDG